jgi:hypothetical protein
MVWCVMVKGPCRGSRCDFWIRVKLRKQTVDEIADEVRGSIVPCRDTSGLEIGKALRDYWTAVGVKDMDLLCQEEPDLCAKIRQVEAAVYSWADQMPI